MVNKENEYLLNVVKYALHDRRIDIPIPPEKLDWNKTIELATRHRISNLLFYGIEKIDGVNQSHEIPSKVLQRIMIREVITSYNQEEEAERLLEKFEAKKVYVLAIKGVKTKTYYPEADMRTMGDIDILYKDSQHEMIKKVMLDMDYEEPQENRKHDHYYRQPFISVEMHRDLLATDSKYYSYYDDIWKRVEPKKGCTYIHEMSIEDEYIYTILHLIEHFKNGGVGIRFIMDIFVYQQMGNLNWDYLKRELEKLQLWDFYSNVSKLAERWFGTKDEIYTTEEEKLLDELSEYIIGNGIFGSYRNASALSIEKVGRIQFLLKAFFPDIKGMQSIYPWLKKYPFLLPWGWILRGVRSFRYKRYNIRKQIDVYKNGDMKYGKELRKFYSRCGL